MVRLHAGAHWRVAFLGFQPGFAYLSNAPPELCVPRLRTPRVRVPEGSVAVAGGYGGIYPAALPGGWRLLGRTAARLFDPAAVPPSLLQPGDRVVFEPVQSLAAAPPPAPARPPGEPLLRVLAPGPFTSVQGAPRYGYGASGVAAGGAMDLPALARANAAVGNPAGAAALEITIAGPELEALVDLRLSRGKLRAGERLRAARVGAGLREYLAVEGGLWQAPPGTPTAPLRRGELLYPASDAPPDLARTGPCSASGELRAMAGPQLDFFTAASIARFFGGEWRVSPQSDRRGLRLIGDPLELSRSPDLPPEGTAPGAVQVPGDGLPIALGPDRPVTGGYPKIATVISADLPLLAQARPGALLRFRQVTHAEALAARNST